MGNINHASISGNLTREPEARYTQGGNCVLTFGVAVGERRKNAQGAYEDYTNFIDCAMFGKRAESLSRILAKGMHVTVEGRLHWSSWERDGQRRSKVELWADEVDLPARAQGAPQAPAQEPVAAPAQLQNMVNAAAQQAQAQSAYDDVIPF